MSPSAVFLKHYIAMLREITWSKDGGRVKMGFQPINQSINQPIRLTPELSPGVCVCAKTCSWRHLLNRKLPFEQGGVVSMQQGYTRVKVGQVERPYY